MSIPSSSGTDCKTVCSWQRSFWRYSIIFHLPETEFYDNEYAICSLETYILSILGLSASTEEQSPTRHWRDGKY